MNGYSPQQVLHILEMDHPIIGQLNGCRSYKQGVEYIEQFKKDVLKQRRLLAKKYHPDISNSEEKMKQINNIVDFVKCLRVVKPAPQPVFVYSFSFNMGTGATTANSYTNIYTTSY